MKFFRDFFLIILSYLLSYINISAQQNNFKIYTIEDGLPQSTIFTMLQDSRGYLWIGTQGGGLCRFDGLNFVTFTKHDGLTGNVIRSVFEDTRKNLWIGTENGLTYYNGLHFKPITSKNGLSGTTVTSISEDRLHNILAGTDNGGLNRISYLEKDSFQIKSFKQSGGLASNMIFDIHLDCYGRIWLATFDGLNILDFNKDPDRPVIKWVALKNINSGELILSVDEDSEHNILIGAQNSGSYKIPLSGIDSGKIISLNKFFDLHDNTIWDIACLDNHDIWFATDKSGVEIIKNNIVKSVVENFSKTTGLPSNQILKIYQDREGNIWLGTNGFGLCRYIGDYFAHYTVNDGLTNNQVFGITQDKEGKYWVATYGGGLNKISTENGKFSINNFSKENGLPDNFLTSIDIANDKTLWIGTANKGIVSYKNGKFISYNITNGLRNNHISCIHAGSKGIIWFGTQEGLGWYDGQRFGSITEIDGLVNNEVQTIIEDNEGILWIGTLGGLAKYDGRNMVNYDEADGLTEKRINTIVGDKKGNIWIGTFGGGLFKLNRKQVKGKVIQFIANDSILSSNNIASLIFQDDTILIVGTEHGFDKIILDQRQKIREVFHYDKSNGFSGVENNQNAIFKDNKGLIWFGTVKGLTSYNLAKEGKTALPPQTHIIDLNLFFERVNWESRSDSVKPWFNLPQKLKLPYYKNHLTFKFIGISLSNPSKIAYSYKLEGWDKDWSPSRKSTEITYSGLEPGKYRFKVKAVNERGVWNKEPIEFSFVIEPPFWKTYWFIFLCGISVVAIFILFIKYREKNLIKEKNILEQKVIERTSEIARQKQEIEIKNKDIVDSIEYAKRIQDALLPAENILEQAFGDYFVLFKPRNIVSGDFYWITALENKIVLAVADCTGHGVPGAFMSMLGVAFLNEIVKKDFLNEADLILEQLRLHVMETLHNASDGMDMALCIFDLRNKKLQFAGAYSPAYLIRDKQIIQLLPDKMPIGFHSASTEIKLFKKQLLDLEDNDVLYFFSDGFKDQFGGSDNSKIKAFQFRQWLLEVHQLPMNEQKNILYQKYESWKGENEQTDDVCLIGIRIKF